MVNREKWSDFKLVKTETRGHTAYSLFKCPFCSTNVRVQAKHAARYKADRCKRHLLVCKGVKTSGVTALDDSRLGQRERSTALMNRRLSGGTKHTLPSEAWFPDLNWSLERTRKLHQFATTFDVTTVTPDEWKRRSEKVSQMIDAVLKESGIMLTHA